MGSEALPVSLAAVTALGDRRRSLEALRQVLAESIDGGPYCEECGRSGPHARDLAALASRLSSVLAELAELSDAVEVSSVDSLAAARAARRARAAGGEPSAV